MALVGLLEYAERRGVSRRAVQKAIDSGRLKRSVTKDGRQWKLDPEMADLEWDRHTAPEKMRSAEQINRGKAKARGEEVEPESEAPMLPPAAGKGAATYSQAKAAAEGYKAMLLKLDYEERAGKLVDAVKVQREMFEAGRRVRDAVLRTSQLMIGDIAQAAGGLTPEQRAEVLLVTERYLVKALEVLSDGSRTGNA